MIFVVIRDQGIGQTLCSFEHVSCYICIMKIVHEVHKRLETKSANVYYYWHLFNRQSLLELSIHIRLVPKRKRLEIVERLLLRCFSCHQPASTHQETNDYNNTCYYSVTMTAPVVQTSQHVVSVSVQLLHNAVQLGRDAQASLTNCVARQPLPGNLSQSHPSVKMTNNDYLLLTAAAFKDLISESIISG